MRCVRRAETLALVAALGAAASARSTLNGQMSAAGGFRLPADHISGIDLKDAHWRGIECFYSYRISDGSSHNELGQTFADRHPNWLVEDPCSYPKWNFAIRRVRARKLSTPGGWPGTMTVDKVVDKVSRCM